MSFAKTYFCESMSLCRKGSKRTKDEGGEDIKVDASKTETDDGMKSEAKWEDSDSDGEEKSGLVPGEEADVRDVIYRLESFAFELNGLICSVLFLPCGQDQTLNILVPPPPAQQKGNFRSFYTIHNATTLKTFESCTPH